MTDDILQPNQPTKFEARNLRPKFRRLKAGDIFLVEMEVTEDVWNELRTVPEAALLENVMWWHDGDAPAEKPMLRDNSEKPGPHGQYWSGMYRKGFINYPDLIEVCGCAGDQIRLRLHDVFQVDSLTQISPQQFEDWLNSEGLHSLITLSRQVQAKLQEAA